MKPKTEMASMPDPAPKEDRSPANSLNFGINIEDIAVHQELGHGSSPNLTALIR